MDARWGMGLLAIAMATPAAGIAAEGGSNVSVFGSYWNTDEADDTWGGGAKARFGMFELRGTYYEDVTADTGPSSRVKIQDIPIEAGVAFNFAPDNPINPYVGAGVSYHLLDSNVGNVDDEVGWYAVVGGEFGMTQGLSLMGEVMYRGVESTVKDLSGGSFISDRANIDLSGFGANVGVAWRF